MIAIIGYNKHFANKLSELLNSFSIENKVTTSEVDIIRADQIVLPNTKNCNKSAKKCQIFNLYSVLNMISKPVLGINSGMQLMMHDLKSSKIKGLGFFNLSNEKLHYGEFEGEFNLVNKIEGHKLCSLFEGTTVKINSDFLLKTNNYCVLSFKVRGEEYSAVICNGNYIGLQFEPDEKAEKFFKYFSTLN